MKKLAIWIPVGCAGLILLTVTLGALLMALGGTPAGGAATGRNDKHAQIELTEVERYTSPSSPGVALYVRNVSDRPVTNLVIDALWRGADRRKQPLAKGSIIIEQVIQPGEGGHVTIHGKVDDSKLEPIKTLYDLTSREKFVRMSPDEQQELVRAAQQMNADAGRLNRDLIEFTFSKTPAYTMKADGQPSVSYQLSKSQATD